MNLDTLQKLIATDEPSAFISLIETTSITDRVTKALNQYDPKLHKVMIDKTARPDKTVKDNNGNISNTIYVSRLALGIQKKIVSTAAGFLGSPSIQCTPAEGKETDLLDIVTKIWDDNKLDYKFRKISKHVMSELHAAEIWYTQELKIEEQKAYWEGVNISPGRDSNVKLSMKIIAPSLGDELYPVWDDFGDMIAFGRKYKIKDGDKDITHFDLYTAESIYMFKDDGGILGFNGTEYVPGYRDGVKNPVRKIPIIYYCQPLTEWEDVQPLIERLEEKISNHADTNNYFDSPILVGKGGTISLPDKGESGKYVEISNPDGSLEYLLYDSLPESMKMEIDNLKMFIFSLTQTPDISFENLKNLGYFSTVALKTMFMDAHMKAMDKEEIFGEGVQRRINYLKKAISMIDPTFKAVLRLPIKPKFNFFLPENALEQIQVLTQAAQAGIISKDTAIRLNPLVEDHASEIEAISKQVEDARANAVVLPSPINQPAV